jgi:hypothetical protein
LSGEVVLVREELPLVRLVTSLSNDPVTVTEGAGGSDDSSEALDVDKVESEDTENVALETVGAKLASLGAVELAEEELDDVLNSLDEAVATSWLLATKGVSSIELRDPDDENARGTGSASSTGVDSARPGNASRSSSSLLFPALTLFGRRSSFLRAKNGEESAFLKAPSPDFEFRFKSGEWGPRDGLEGGEGPLRSLLDFIFVESN